MKKWITGNQKHIFILGILLLYLFAANRLYVQFFLKNGKPLKDRVSLPAQAGGIVYQLGTFQPVRINGQDLYELKGYAFRATKPETAGKITIVLRSDTQSVAFPTRGVLHPNMIESYSGYTPGMDHDEFSLLLSNQAIKPGNYQIGILIEDPGGKDRSYVNTGGTIQKTPNTIQYIPAP